MRLFFILFFPGILALNIKNFVKTSIISSSLFLNNIEPIQALPKTSFETIADQNIHSSTKISMERNNIYIYGAITPESCENLKTKLQDLDYNGRIFKINYNTDPPPINLHIQSTGGSLLNSLYIVDLIQSLETPINTFVDGYAASAASIISVVGNNRYMTKNSMILIHQLSSGKEGKFQELDDDMKNLQQLMNKVKRIYLEHTNIPFLELNEILQHDLWLDAETCKKYGLVDEII